MNRKKIISVLVLVGLLLAVVVIANTMQYYTKVQSDIHVQSIVKFDGADAKNLSVSENIFLTQNASVTTYHTLTCSNEALNSIPIHFDIEDGEMPNQFLNMDGVYLDIFYKTNEVNPKICADVMVSEDNPTENNADTILRLRTLDGNRRHFFIKACNPCLPHDSIIESATLYLYNYAQTDGSAVGHKINLYNLTQGWKEGILTWENQFSRSMGTDYYPIPICNTTMGSPNNWICFDVTDYIQRVVEMRQPNYGWWIKDVNESSSVISDFYSSEAENEYKPYLEVIVEKPIWQFLMDEDMEADIYLNPGDKVDLKFVYSADVMTLPSPFYQYIIYLNGGY